MTRLRGTVWKRSAASLAIWGLLCQLVLTAAAIPTAFAASRPGVLPDGFTSIVICTANGMKRIVLDADGVPVEESRQDDPLDHCTACHLVNAGALVAASAALPACPYCGPALLTPAVMDAVSAKPDCRLPDSRAPPLEL